MTLTLVTTEAATVLSGGGCQALVVKPFWQSPLVKRSISISLSPTHKLFLQKCIPFIPDPGGTPNLFNELMLKSKTKDQKKVRSFSFQLRKHPKPEKYEGLVKDLK